MRALTQSNLFVQDIAKIVAAYLQPKSFKDVVYTVLSTYPKIKFVIRLVPKRRLRHKESVPDKVLLWIERPRLSSYRDWNTHHAFGDVRNDILVITTGRIPFPFKFEDLVERLERDTLRLPMPADTLPSPPLCIQICRGFGFFFDTLTATNQTVI